MATSCSSSRLDSCCLSFPIFVSGKEQGDPPQLGAGGDTCFSRPRLSHSLTPSHIWGASNQEGLPGVPLLGLRVPKELGVDCLLRAGLCGVCRRLPVLPAPSWGRTSGSAGSWPGGPRFSLPRPHFPALNPRAPGLTPSSTRGFGFRGLGGLGFLFPQLLSLGRSLQIRGHGERRGTLRLPSPSNPLEPPEIASDYPKECCNPCSRWMSYPCMVVTSRLKAPQVLLGAPYTTPLSF